MNLIESDYLPVHRHSYLGQRLKEYQAVGIQQLKVGLLTEASRWDHQASVAMKRLKRERL